MPGSAVSRFARRHGFIALFLVLAGTPTAKAEDVVLTAHDGTKVFGEVWRAKGERPPVILAFHMAGSNHAEYATIGPRLSAAGFDVLAIDQRSGGAQFGANNKTVETLGHSTAYAPALADLEAALDWGRLQAKGAPILIWGSSYSAALVFVLAAKSGADIAGILAFSPGEYLTGDRPVHTAAAKVKVPVFVTQAKDRDEVEAARSILAAVGGADKTQFVPKIAGIHGSSTLREDADPRGAAENWQAVLAFLQRYETR
jgi:dienelactone hydrolase